MGLEVDLSYKNGFLVQCGLVLPFVMFHLIDCGIISFELKRCVQSGFRLELENL